jgi:ribose 5-phosphate isomerase A
MGQDIREEAKRRAAERAVEFLKDGQIVGLGTGSTAIFAIRAIGRLVREGLKIRGVPTSVDTARCATELGIPLVDLNETCSVDITIDGADQIDGRFDMIKGGGGALVREKLVAHVTEREVIVVDPSKPVATLGGSCPVPVEVLPFGWCLAARLLAKLGCTPSLRQRNGQSFVSDNGNYIVDCEFGDISDPGYLERSIKELPGVVETGLFVGLAHTLIVGTESGADVTQRFR